MSGGDSAATRMWGALAVAVGLHAALLVPSWERRAAPGRSSMSTHALDVAVVARAAPSPAAATTQPMIEALPRALAQVAPQRASSVTRRPGSPPAPSRTEAPPPQDEAATQSPSSPAAPALAPATAEKQQLAVEGTPGGAPSGVDAGSGPGPGPSTKMNGTASARGDGETSGAKRPAATSASTGDLIAALLRRVRAHRHYPELARRRGIEGTVGVRFVSRGDGSAEVSVVRSADPLLDEAARAAVGAAGPFPSLAGPQEIDVEFHLDDD